ENGKINVNSADEAALCTLPGIGSSRAKAILQYRREHGPFASVEELLEVPGIKEGILEQFRDLIEVR
ncbi:MAG: helix-hairpin-helix domain-containing protein, partial [Lachnospiraceae bacterium]|nr:helix-hairpin-helix domain-containing protein [Lachnospiraceae bacterium]